MAAAPAGSGGVRTGTARRGTAVVALVVLASWPPGAAELAAVRGAGARRDAAQLRPAATGRAYDELTAEQKRVFDGGGQVFVSRDVAGSPWPAVVVYQHMDATPEAAAAVFVDYGQHRTFIPGVRQSRVSLTVDPTTHEVDYVLRVPVVSDERYTVRNHLSRYEGGRSYRVDWTLVRATSTRAIAGHVRFEPHLDASSGARGTVMAYANAVTPGSRLARFGVIKTRAVQQMRATASALVARVQAERAGDPALLSAKIRALRATLGP